MRKNTQALAINSLIVYIPGMSTKTPARTPLDEIQAYIEYVGVETAATMSGCSQRTIYNVRNGSFNPSYPVLMKLLAAAQKQKKTA